MNNQENWVVLAQFGRPHGVKGFVKVHSFTEPRDNVLQYATWYAFMDGKWRALKLLHAEMQNKFIIVQIEGYVDRESAATLTHVRIAVKREQLKKLAPGEYYWHQLIGMKVMSPKGDLFGTVTEIIPTGVHDVLVVEGEKRHLIPYLPARFVLDVDSDQQIITVDWDSDF